MIIAAIFWNRPINASVFSDSEKSTLELSRCAAELEA
jgi:hypothetical protein